MKDGELFRDTLLTLNALTAADSVLIPLQCEYYALEGLSQLMQTVELVRRGLNPGLATEGILRRRFWGSVSYTVGIVAFFKRRVQG